MKMKSILKIEVDVEFWRKRLCNKNLTVGYMVELALAYAPTMRVGRCLKQW
jgi:hypothetical protein